MRKIVFVFDGVIWLSLAIMLLSKNAGTKQIEIPFDGGKTSDTQNIRILSPVKDTLPNPIIDTLEPLEKGEKALGIEVTHQKTGTVAIDICVEVHTTNEVCGPHAGGQSFTTDIPEGQHYLAVTFVNRKKVAREVPHRKDLARDFKLGVSDQTGSAKPSMDLCGFKNLGVKLRIVLLECG